MALAFHFTVAELVDILWQHAQASAPGKEGAHFHLALKIYYGAKGPDERCVSLIAEPAPENVTFVDFKEKR